MGLVVSTVQYIFGVGRDMDTPDEATGLTERQKDAIRASWALVSINLKGNGVSFLIKFFQDYPEDKAFFEAFKDKKPEELGDNPKMRAHASTVMHALTSVVDNLDDPECLIDILKKNAQSHFGRNIRIQQYKDLFETFIRFLQEGLGDKCTDLTKESWEKALGVVVSVIESEMTALSNGPTK
ncbi:globin-like [Haliotis rufescens]|uniref:globin-like n=1 Tax=Haliotis rufescens TaxID=6454 RepID=UPI00201F5A3A|nr:globin-like [Haliotis rufescens]XP_048257415.1 globin-like [Haliotis rufescens]